MPLRDHFQQPDGVFRLNESFLAQWTGTIAAHLNGLMPEGYVAYPRFRPPYIPYEESDDERSTWEGGEATFKRVASWSGVRNFDVLVHDVASARRLAAVIQVVGPQDKGSRVNRKLFVAKSAANLQDSASVVLVDVVTNHGPNLYSDLLTGFGLADPHAPELKPAISVVSLRTRPEGESIMIEGWFRPLCLGEPLPSTPLWLAERLSLRLDLEATYEKTLADLRIR